MDSTVSFNLQKLQISDDQEGVRYSLVVNDRSIDLNSCIGKTLRLMFAGRIHCVACGRMTKKSFNQGYCYPCFRSLAACDRCIISPQWCHYHQGTCREPEWGETHCMQPHIVYLANTSGLKVGITRQSRIPARWLDQGAYAALMILEVPSRLASGLVEVMFKQHVSDRTDWRRMLKGDPEPVDLPAERDRLMALCRAEHREISDAVPIPDAPTRIFSYPVSKYPQKPNAVNLDKQSVVEGTLVGIKGQYLILDTGVLNIWRHAGYQVSLQFA